MEDPQIDAKRNALLVLNPHVYYDEHDRYSDNSILIPRGHWITLELAVRSHGWEKVERNPRVMDLLNRLPVAVDVYREYVTGTGEAAK